MIDRAAASLSSGATDALACAAAAVLEAAIVAGLRWGVPGAAILVLHGVVVASLAGYLAARIRRAGDVGMATLALVAVASTGPIGASGCALLAWLRLLPIGRSLAGRTVDKARAETGAMPPAAVLADRVRSGRVLDALAPVPRPLELALTAGVPADRKAALCRLSSAYETMLSEILKTALTSEMLPVRAPSHAIFACLLERAFTRAKTLAALPVAGLTDADRAVAAAGALLQHTPFEIVASPVCDAVAERVHALCMGVLSAHPGHLCARVLRARALMMLRKHEQAERLLNEIGNDDEDAAGLRLECLARLGRFEELGALRARAMTGER
jgi:hypothetical protein